MNHIQYLTPVILTNLTYLNINLLLLQFIFNDNNVRFANLTTAEDYIYLFENYPNTDLQVTVRTAINVFLQGKLVFLSNKQGIEKLLYRLDLYSEATGTKSLYASTIEEPSCQDFSYTLFEDKIAEDTSRSEVQLKSKVYSFQLTPAFSDNDTYMIPDSFYCKFTNYQTSISFGIQLSATVSYFCTHETLEDPLCRPFMCRDAESCTRYFILFKEHCEDQMNSDFCFDYVNRYFKYVGPSSQMDSVLDHYCSNKHPSQLFSEKSRDFYLCSCHMSNAYYANFSDFAQAYANSQGYGLLLWISDICSFPPCTISFPNYPYTGPRCSNNVCYNVQRYNDDGTVQGISLIIDSGCFGKLSPGS